MSRINDYLPKILQDILELKKTNESLDVELENISNNIDTMNKETIVATATLYGIKKWEKVLGINPKEGESLDVRRFRIQNILTNKLPFTYRWLVNKLKEITGSESGFTLDISYDDYEITIVLSGLDVDIMAEVQKQLRIAIPANMELLISGPQIQSSEIKVGIGMMYGTKYKIKSAKTGFPAGKNIFNINGTYGVNYATFTKINYGFRATPTGGLSRVVFPIFVIEGQEYTVSFNLKSNEGTLPSSICRIREGKNGGSWVGSGAAMQEGDNIIKLTPTSSGNYYLWFYFNALADFVDYDVTLSDIQMEPGSEKTPFEPFIEL